MTEPASYDDLGDLGEMVVATAKLGERSGGRHFEIGYHENPHADWYAHIRFKGGRISVEGQPSAADAARSLAMRLLSGARCKCGKLVAVTGVGAAAFNATMIDGKKWTAREALAAGQCWWDLRDGRWQSGCDAPPVKLPAEMR